VAPYFAASSGGAYSIEFVSNGTFQMGRDDGPDDCVTEALARTDGSFTNVLVADDTHVGGGFASPGTIYTSSPPIDFDVFDRTPQQSRRSGWVGGATISVRPSPGTIVHELGHTLHWPHSYVGPGDEYDNPIDVMSSGFGRCRVGTVVYSCDPGSTLAFNRLASGWLRDGQVITHPSGTANYVLDPPNGPGLQLIVAPDPSDPESMLTLDARPAIGDDVFVPTEGVALHVIDQQQRYGSLSGLSTSRIQRQAIGPGDSYDHVLEIGESATVHGLTITVLRRDGDRFELRVAGTYRPPDDAFFTEALAIRPPSCATFDIDDALDAGCRL